MPQIKKILVALDLSEMDSKLLAFAKSLNLLLRPEKFFFANIHKDVLIPTDIQEQFPDLETSIDEKFIQKMVEETNQFNFFGAEKEYLALHGDPLMQVVQLATEEKVDLVIVGKKSTADHKGLMHRKLIRKTPCDVLVLTENSSPGFDKIMVATDFSEYSKMAVERSLYLGEKSESTIICEHIYTVPTGYYKTGKSYTEFAQIMREHSVKAFEKYKASFGGNMDHLVANYTLSEKKDIAENIASAATENKIDLLIVGSKGMSNMAVAMLGSVSEELVENDFDVPVLIVKDKTERLGFWEAFFKL